MKKILLSISLIGTALFSYAQTYPMTGFTTSTGVVTSPGPCTINPVGPTSCPKICTNSLIVSPAGAGLWDITFNYYNPTAGAKGIRILIKCGTTTLVDQCMDATTPKDVLYFKTYTNVPCSLLADIEILLTPFTGGTDCGGSACGPTERSVGGAPLPVTFASFNATRNKNNVILKWETASEQNNRGFDVQRFIGSGNWESVAFVSSRSANGSSTTPLNYEFTDINTTKGISQYRILQVDMDGKSSYSMIRSIRGEGQTGKTILYPNPSNNGKVNIVFEDGNVTRDVTLIDMNGRTVKQWKGTSNNNIQMENLNAGFYTVLINNRETGEQTNEKIIVNKR